VSRRISLVAAAATLALVLAAGIGLSSAGGATPSASTTKTFSFTGGEEIFTVPSGVTSLNVLAVGGRGSNGAPGPSPGAGGFGASTTAELAVLPGQILFIEVGGNGGLLTGGFNGGGAAGSGGVEITQAGGGGGATDIRTISRAAAGNTLASRLIIAGGGGGGGGTGQSSAAGGKGGQAAKAGLSGNGSHGDNGGGGGGGGTGGQGGTQTSGGLSFSGPGTLGQGGDGSSGSFSGGGGGGGGGKYGGGGGQTGLSGGGGGGGGGGSTSFAATATNTSFDTDSSGVPLLRLTYNTGGANKSGLKYGKLKLNKNKGTAILPVTVPGSGNLSIGGKAVVKKRAGLDGFSRLAKAVPQAGTYNLTVKAKGKNKRKLLATGKVKVKAVVTFKPTSGDAVHDTRGITLKKN
jgi:hypothetical protein